jgi:tRNA pseudouridine38-40 synthase
MDTLLARTSRADEIAVAAAHGLTLVTVGYPSPDQYAAQAAVARRRRGL